MHFKTFMTSVEENLSRCRTEAELRNWIENHARSLPEDDWKLFRSAAGAENPEALRKGSGRSIILLQDYSLK